MLAHICLLSSFVISIFSAEVPYLTEPPPYLPPCQINDPEFVNCSTHSVQSLFTEIGEKNGLPGLEHIPPIDPLLVEKIKVTQSGTEALNIKLDLSNVSVKGFGKLRIVESRVSPKDYSWETKIYLPKMIIKGDYILKGRILLIGLNGRGKMSLQIDDPNINLHTKTKLYEKGGLTFYNVTNTECEYSLSKLSVFFDNLFNGNKILEDSTNIFFNENWENFNEALKPVIRRTISDVFLSYMQKIFHSVPAEFLITDIPTPKELYGE